MSEKETSRANEQTGTAVQAAASAGVPAAASRRSTPAPVTGKPAPTAGKPAPSTGKLAPAAGESAPTSASGKPASITAMLAVLMAGTFTASYAQSMMNIALPKVAHDFGITLSEANWIVVGFTIVAATTITIAAVLIKRVGLRKLFTISCIGLIAGSVLGLFSFTFPLLMGARLVQAICTGLVLPTVTGVIVVIAPPHQRGVLLAANSAIIGLGLAVGPLVSGLILTYVNLQLVFAVPVVLGVVLWITGAVFLRNVYDREHIRLDVLSVVLSFVGLALIVYGLSEITHDTLPSVIALVIGAVICALFVWRQLRIDNPLLNLRPLSHRDFTIGIVLIMLGMMANSSLALLLPLFFEGTFGYSAFLAGVLMLAPVLLYAGLAVWGGRFFDRHGMWPLVPVGFAMVMLGSLGVLLISGTRDIVWIVVIAAIGYSGIGLIIAPCKSVALSILPKEQTPYGSSINSTFVQIAESIGSALFVGVLSADVLRATAAGVSHADAYAAGFDHTLIIAVVFMAVGLVVATIYAFHHRKRKNRG